MMMRAVIAVIVGYAAWTALWLGGNALWLPEAAEVVQGGRHYGETGPLAIAIGLSVACSLVAGLACAWIARTKGRGATLVLVVLLLGTGIAVQLGVWDLMPAWYHFTFLLLLAPMTMIGSLIVPGRRSG